MLNRDAGRFPAGPGNTGDTVVPDEMDLSDDDVISLPAEDNSKIFHFISYS